MTTAVAPEELVRLAAPRLVRSPADVGPAGSLADALTARGFFCAGRREEVLVFDDRDAGDVRSLIGVVPTALAPSVSAFSIPPLSSEETSGLVHRILSLPSPQGTTAIGVRWSTWASYRRCRFGARLQPASLDASVALLVRVLNMLGCPTRYSGHGIGDSYRSVIQFDGAYSEAWATFVFALLDRAEGIRPSDGWLHIGRESRDASVAAEQWAKAVRVAVALRSSLDFAALRRLRSMTIASFNVAQVPAPDAAAFLRRAQHMLDLERSAGSLTSSTASEG